MSLIEDKVAGRCNEIVVKLFLYFFAIISNLKYIMHPKIAPISNGSIFLGSRSVDFRFIKSTEELGPLRTCHKLPLPVLPLYIWCHGQLTRYCYKKVSKRTQHHYFKDISSYQGWMNFLMAVCAVGIAMMSFLRLNCQSSSAVI